MALLNVCITTHPVSSEKYTVYKGHLQFSENGIWGSLTYIWAAIDGNKPSDKVLLT